MGTPNATPYCKDAFHDYVVGGRADAVNPARRGTKAAAVYRLTVPAGGELRVRLRLDEVPGDGQPAAPSPFADFDASSKSAGPRPTPSTPAKPARSRPTSSWSSARPTPACSGRSSSTSTTCAPGWRAIRPRRRRPASRQGGRNAEWRHLYNRDVLSMPDKWEYPWYAAWDLAFHTVPLARIDPAFAKEQLMLLTREWYMHPNGQLPAYEYAFGDVNPPVHAWAAWRVYKIGRRARAASATASFWPACSRSCCSTSPGG